MNPVFLTPNDWFGGAQTTGTFVWSPAPAAAEVVVERLGVAKHKRPESLHMVLVPRLMTGRWRKHLGRATDFYFKIDQAPVWPLSSLFEPVLVFVSLPLVPHLPNFEARDDLLARFHRVLSGPQLQEIHTPSRRDLLCQLFSEARDLSSV